MSFDWQTLVAGAVVVITALIFLVRLARPRPGGGCGGCGGCRKNRPK